MRLKSFLAVIYLLKELNATFLVLILKTPRASPFNEFRPINLCNSIYNIFSKVLEIRLQRVLPLIISLHQSGFVAGRKILDPIITVHENIHSLMVNKRTSFLLKLNLVKSYEWVNWSFLFKILYAFGFFDNFVKLIQSLISMVSFFVLVNGSPSYFFKSSRGLDGVIQFHPSSSLSWLNLWVGHYN